MGESHEKRAFCSFRRHATGRVHSCSDWPSRYVPGASPDPVWTDHNHDYHLVFYAFGVLFWAGIRPAGVLP